MSLNKQITSTVTDSGKLEIAITESKRHVPSEDEVLIQVEATPINPSDVQNWKVVPAPPLPQALLWVHALILNV